MSPAIELRRSMPIAWSALLNRLAAPVDISFLVYFRIAFGAVVLWQVWGIFANDWVERFLTGKEFYFKYWPFYFVHPWPGDGMNIHVALLAVFAALGMVGLLYRFSAAATFFLLTYIFLLDRALYLNHLYLTCLIAFVMIFLPAHRGLSVDALLRPGLRSTMVPAWTLWLLRFQVAVPMFFGGVAKISSDWLHGQPLVAFLQGQTDFPVIGQLLPLPPVAWLLTYGALLIDLLFILYLANRRTRVFGFIAVLAFHFINSRLFDIGIFPWLMIAGTLIFFPPAWPRRMWWDIRQVHSRRLPAMVLGFALGAYIGGTLPADFSWVHIIIGGLGGAVAAYHFEEPFRRLEGEAAPESMTNRSRANRRRARNRRSSLSPVAPPLAPALPGLVGKWTPALLGIWIAMQVIIPLRHFVIPSNVHWTEEGYTFSWHMMLRQKPAGGVFIVTDRASGEEWTVDPAEYLTARQQLEMPKYPDMIRQFALHLEERFRAKGHNDVEVRARIAASLNNREPQMLVNPNIDLTQFRRPWLGRADWILPLEIPLRARN